MADITVREPAISWRCIFAGTLCALVTYVALSCVGIAITGHAMQAADTGGQGLAVGIGSATWMILSGAASLLVGGFFAVRCSQQRNRWAGSAQGLLVASLFYTVLIIPIGGAIGLVNSAIGNAISGITKVAGTVASHPKVQGSVERAFGDLNFKDGTEKALSTLITRLISGDVNGATRYIASQAGISSDEATRRLDNLRTEFQGAVREAKSTVAATASVIGWSVFASLLAGVMCGMWGGAMGARRNGTRPISRETFETTTRVKAA